MAMTLRLDDDETAALQAAAEREAVSMHELVRRALRSYLEGWERDREAFLSQFAKQNRSLLDRLAR